MLLLSLLLLLSMCFGLLKHMHLQGAIMDAQPPPMDDKKKKAMYKKLNRSMQTCTDPAILGAWAQAQKGRKSRPNTQTHVPLSIGFVVFFCVVCNAPEPDGNYIQHVVSWHVPAGTTSAGLLLEIGFVLSLFALVLGGP